MTHDPLCESYTKHWCVCDLIAKVDERANSAMINHYQNGWEMGIAESREAINSLVMGGAVGSIVLISKSRAIDAINNLLGKS